MDKVKIKLNILSFAIPAVLIPLLFVPSAICRMVSAAALIVLAAVSFFVFKKRNVPSVNFRNVAGLLAVIAIVYLSMYYLTGIWFGYDRNPLPLSWDTFLRFVLPSAVIVVAVELIRAVLLGQQNKSSMIAAYVTGIIADLLIGYGLSRVGDLSYFMDIVGLTLFPAITSNLLYQYLSKRYGSVPVIVYRAIMILPISFMPMVPALSDAMHSFALIVLPLAVWTFIDLLYEKKTKRATKKPSKLSYVGTGATLVFMILTLALISGQFKYGMLVIATPSMTGELNVGDAAVYEEYDGEVINEGDVIVFTKDERTLIVHRVVDIQNIDGRIYYTTKGDANNGSDAGYVVASDIRGIVRFKVSHIGHPTLWMREILS